MKITIRQSTMVPPSSPTLLHRLWISNIDLVVPRIHTPCVYFYCPDSTSSNFFDADKLKSALGKTLVPFYPVAGRLARDERGRIEINCSAEGALFVEAEAPETTVDDFGDFAPTMEMDKLIPTVMYTDDISSFPLLVVQVTYFKCGGVSLGVRIHHTVNDGFSGLHFINSWSDVARGASIAVQPFIDRTLLRARDPPSPSFPHIEYQPPPTMASISSPSTEPASQTLPPTAANMFKFSRSQVEELRRKLTPTTLRLSTFSVLAAHVWRCVCLARELPPDQMTKMYISTDGRTRLMPPLPEGYFGNVMFNSTPIASCEQVLSDGAVIIQNALSRRDDEYCRSAIDYLELQPDLSTLLAGANNRCPNIRLVSWVRLPIHDADFGWGRPIFMGPGGIALDGLAFVLPSRPTGDGSLSVAISLQAAHMAKFKELVYQI